MSEDWARWENEVINGVFPLRRLLGVSDHSGVFLTEYKARNIAEAALKLIPAIPAESESQLAQWRATAALAHPRLIRLLAMGRCQLGGLPFLFVLMEYADQNLSQILPKRALTSDEVREMLPPTLDALAFLHGQHQVQGRLKPTNVLVVGDQLKLASDAVRPAGAPSASVAESSVYDPPEAGDGISSLAGDIWRLGVTVVEALTQHPPTLRNKRFDAASLPASFPAGFAEIVRQCLNSDPAKRPTVAELETHLKMKLHPPTAVSPTPESAAPAPPPAAPAPPVNAPVPTVIAPVPPVIAPQPSAATQPTAAAPQPSAAVPETPVPEMPNVAATLQHARKRRYIAALAVALVASLAIWAGLHNKHASRTPTTPAPPPEAAAPPASIQPPAPVTSDSTSVLHEEIPDVSRSARDTIRGRIQVAVRVTVDSSGNVTSATLANPGSSRYFARLATDAAKKWKFAPAAADQDPRKWLLTFEFTRSGATGHASTPRS